jgi:two-component system chemotaxis sensor kinase CheA
MTDDLMNAFRRTYLEESFEGLAAMESYLLALSSDSKLDVDAINTIFRAVHTMKSGAGIFNFVELIRLMHVLETMLDEIRSGSRSITILTKALLLRSVDVLHQVLDDYQMAKPLDIALIQEMESQLVEALNEQEENSEGARGLLNEKKNLNANAHFHITITPTKLFFSRGIDLIKLIEELSHLDSVSLQVTTCTDFPDNAFKPTDCYLSFHIDLKGMVSQEQIEEVFEWLDEECPVIISAVAGLGSPSVSSTVTQTERRVPEFDRAEKSVGIASSQQAESSIRVSIGKIDQMVDLVGEMVIAQSMLSQFGALAATADMPWADKLKEGLMAIERHTRTMQESVMSIRMMPISFAFNRMPRLVHDVSASLNKEVELLMVGEQTEVDKTVLEKLTDPLVHIIRNAIDHGIEFPDIRVAHGKSRKGIIRLSAFHSGGNIVIKIEDDGTGINLEKVKAKSIQLGIIQSGQMISDKELVESIFHAGFSTADQVTNVSGRGVGMDVVRRNIKELGGSVEVETHHGKGSAFIIRLPLTLAILEGQLSKLGEEVYIFPLSAIVETIQPIPENIKYLTGKELFRLRDRYLPVLRLNQFFARPVGRQNLTDGLLVIVEHGNKQFGVFVDSLETQQQVVIKSMESNYRKVQGVAGATILGDGRVSMILEISELAQAVGDRDE